MTWFDALLIFLGGIIVGGWFTWWVMVPPIGRGLDEAVKGNVRYGDHLVEWKSKKDKESRGR